MKKRIILLLIVLHCFVHVQHAQQLFLSSAESSEIVNKAAPLWNPDRGLHLESIYQVSSTEGYIPNPYKREDYPVGFMDTRNTQFESKGDSVTLTQLYIYLTEFWDSDEIASEALSNIQLLFDGLRDHRVKAILRFAYSRDDGRLGNGHSGSNPTYSRIMKHLDQLEPVIKANWDVISVVEAGLLGTWGEWTPSLSTAENNNLVKTLFSYLPEGHGMVVRYIWIRNNLKSVLTTNQMTNYIGFCNDYFTTGTKGCDNGSDWCMYSTDYYNVADVSFNTYMRGEIPYNEGPPWGFDIIMNPMTVLEVLKDHHYSAMDITQNFSDNITYWKTAKVYPAQLERNGIFFDEHYFIENGKTVIRSLYDFIRDHLGYRLNIMPDPVLKKEGSTLAYDIKLTNTGFATVLNPKPVYLVLIDENNQVAKEIELTDISPRDWQPWASGKPTELLTHTISGQASIDLTGTYRIGIWMPDAQESARNIPAYNIKFALDNGVVTHWRNDSRVINLIGEVQL